MRKIVTRMRMLSFFVLILGGLMFFWPGEAPALHAQDGDLPDPLVISPELLSALDALEATVEEIRGLQLTDPITRLFPTREEAIAFFMAVYEAELDDQTVFEETQFYRAFDFIEAGFDLRALYLALITEQVAGYYNTETKEMNTILLSGRALGDRLPFLEQVIYAHEYTHALQDQYFDLDAMLSQYEEPDQVLAVLSLIEGDATYVMQEYMTAYLAENPAAILQLLGLTLSGQADIPPGTPAILEAELTAPYIDGLNFVMALLREGGWQMVDAAFADPPISMAQIYDPQKYLKGVLPLTVALDPTDALFSADWALLMERTLGEFYLRHYLQTQLTRQQAQQGARGWAGDRFRLYYNENADEHAWVLSLLWENDAAGVEFEALYGDFLAARLGTDQSTPVESGGQCWQDRATAEAICMLAQTGQSLIAYAPDADLAMALITSQRR